MQYNGFLQRSLLTWESVRPHRKSLKFTESWYLAYEYAYQPFNSLMRVVTRVVAYPHGCHIDHSYHLGGISVLIAAKGTQLLLSNMTGPE